MNKLDDISVGAVVILIGLIIIEVWFMIDDKDYEYITLQELDINKDGIVSRKELKYYLTNMEKAKKRQQLKTKDILRSVTSGVVRGFMMGLILGTFEGGVILGLTLGIINPILSGFENTVL
jgi:F0F1-type ATP synthase assembly protein I